jgi:hypothetical protein
MLAVRCHGTQPRKVVKNGKRYREEGLDDREGPLRVDVNARTILTRILDPGIALLPYSEAFKHL